MPKQMWTEAPEAVKGRVHAKLRFGGRVLNGSGGFMCTSAATAWIEAATTAWSCGFDIEAPTSKTIDELAELEAAKHPEAGRFRVAMGIELAQERRNQTRWDGMRRWAAGPSEREVAAQRHAEAQRQRDALELEQRTDQILKEDTLTREEAARAKAKAKAEKERASARATAEKQLQGATAQKEEASS